MFLKQIKYKIVNEFNIDKDLSKEDMKLLFNKKLLKVIFSIEKNWFGRCNFE